MIDLMNPKYYFPVKGEYRLQYANATIAEELGIPKENIILKGPEIFTKADLREKCPYISDSTINRTLDRMKDQGLIDNLGTGRSAKWIKKIKTEKKISQMEQSNIFDMINEFQNK